MPSLPAAPCSPPGPPSPPPAPSAPSAIAPSAGPPSPRHTPTFGSPDYDAALKVTTGMKGIFQSPHGDAQFVGRRLRQSPALAPAQELAQQLPVLLQDGPGGSPHPGRHLCLRQYPQLQRCTLWAKYKIGEKYAITDPTTNAPAVRNVFLPSRFGPDAPKDITAPNNYYQDTGIEVLQQRGTIFLTCNNSLNGHASGAIADKRAPAGMDASGRWWPISRRNLIPGAVLCRRWWAR